MSPLEILILLPLLAALALVALFSRSVMFRHDSTASVRRAFRKPELDAIAAEADVPAKVHRSFPYRLVLVAAK